MAHPRLYRWSVFALAAVAISGPHAPADVVYVDASASGANNGTSWADAFTTLQAGAGAAAPGDEVWVRAGTYSPGAAGIALPNGAALYGGFNGAEVSRDQRDWSANVTVIQGTGPIAGGSRTLLASGTGPGTALDGFTVRDGYAVQVGGGGLAVTGGRLEVRNCVFANNFVNFQSGGALYALDSVLGVENCTFSGNYAHLGSGGAIGLFGNTDATIRDSRFVGNTAVTSGSGGEGMGAGLHSYSNLPLTVVGCSFESNTGRSFFSCLNSSQYAYGGGIMSFLGGLTVRDCVFRGNSAHYGGGLFTWADTQIVNSVFSNNTATTVCIQSTSAGGEGGAVGAWTFQPATVTLTNCTIAGNRGGEAAGVVSYSAMIADVRNSIIWNNIASGQDVDPRNRQIKGTFDARFSCIQDLLTAPPGEDPYDPANYPGCIVVSPQLVDGPGGDMHLMPSSPCIDAGDSTLLPAGLATDLDGRVRRFDVVGVPDSGAGGPPMVDMGAYEFGAPLPAPPCPADFNNSGSVTTQDIFDFLAAFFTPGSTAADFNHSGAVTTQDIFDFLAAFFTPCG